VPGQVLWRRGLAAVALGGALLACRGARAAPAADSIRYATVVSNANRIGLTLTNYGFFGTAFSSRAPSLEFPLGSGYEHLSRAGLWVGAHAIAADGSTFTGVSTAIVDEIQGTSGASETEFTPAGTAIIARSRIQNSRSFSPLAVSDLDETCSYSDEPGHPGRLNSTEDHRPLDLLVRQRTLAFSLEAADAFVVVQFTIVNAGPAPLADAWVALYAQLVSGDKNAYPSWPPSSTAQPGSWYYKAHIEYDPARRLYQERYCRSAPYPGNCASEFCPPWAGMKLLGVHPDTIATKTVGFHWWSYSPADTARSEDVQRYRLMSDGATDDPATCVPGSACSPIGLLSVGPFDEIDPGDSIQVDFAFVGGEDHDRLLEHADFAQFARDIRYQLPTPPPSPRLLVETAGRRVDLYWDDSAEQATDPTSPAPGHHDFEGYRVYFGSDRQRPGRIAQFDLRDTTGFNTGLDSLRLATPRTRDGITYRYHYAVTGLRDGFSYYGAVTSYDTGDPQVPSLESGLAQNKFLAVPAPAPSERDGGVTVFPNPYRVEARWDAGRNVRDHYLWFARLPARCVIRIFTLSGDLVAEAHLDGGAQGPVARGLYNPRTDIDTPPPALSGGSWAWNLITRRNQAAATGLYVWSVEDLATGHFDRGKLLIVKSDRE
jgi:hypothetical protein